MLRIPLVMLFGLLINSPARRLSYIHVYVYNHVGSTLVTIATFSMHSTCIPAWHLYTSASPQSEGGQLACRHTNWTQCMQPIIYMQHVHCIVNSLQNEPVMQLVGRSPTSLPCAHEYYYFTIKRRSRANLLQNVSQPWRYLLCSIFALSLAMPRSGKQGGHFNDMAASVQQGVHQEYG